MIRHAAQTIKHLVLTLLLLIGGVCALEVALRLQRATSAAGSSPDRVSVAAAVTTPSRSTYLSVTPKLRITRIDPPSGKSFTLRTNSFGLRNPEFDSPKPTDVFRVLCLGDDTTFAGDVPESYTYCKLLADDLQPRTSTRVEVLNAGCPGACPTVEALLLRHRLLLAQPDVILVHIDPSDIADEETLRRHVERTAEGFPLSAMHPATAGKTNVASQLDDEFLIVRSLRMELQDLWVKGQSGGVRAANERAETQDLGGALQSIKLALEEMKCLAGAHSINVMVTVAAPGSGSKGGSASGRADVWPPQELAGICDELGLPLIDASAELEQLEEEPRSRRKRTGLSADEHAVYAEVLSAKLIQAFMGQRPPERMSSRSPKPD